jgi:hypothetical protein
MIIGYGHRHRFSADPSHEHYMTTGQLILRCVEHVHWMPEANVGYQLASFLLLIFQASSSSFRL